MISFAPLVGAHFVLPWPLAGSDSGFGHALSKYLDKLGFTVFAGVQNEKGSGAEELRRTCSKRLSVLQLDVTNPQQIKDAYSKVVEKVQNRGTAFSHLCPRLSSTSLQMPSWVPASNSHCPLTHSGCWSYLNTCTVHLPHSRASHRREDLRNESGMICSHRTYRILYPIHHHPHPPPHFFSPSNINIH